MKQSGGGTDFIPGVHSHAVAMLYLWYLGRKQHVYSEGGQLGRSGDRVRRVLGPGVQPRGVDSWFFSGVSVSPSRVPKACGTKLTPTPVGFRQAPFVTRGCERKKRQCFRAL